MLALASRARQELTWVGRGGNLGDGRRVVKLVEVHADLHGISFVADVALLVVVEENIDLDVVRGGRVDRGSWRVDGGRVRIRVWDARDGEGVWVRGCRERMERITVGVVFVYVVDVVDEMRRVGHGEDGERDSHGECHRQAEGETGKI